MLTKGEFINYLSEKNDLTKKAAREVVDMMVNGIVDAVNEHDGVNFVGFAQFYKELREEKAARNPATGEEIIVPAHYQAKIKPGKSFKDAVR